MIGYFYWLASFAFGTLAANRLEECEFLEKLFHGLIFGTMAGAWLLFLHSLAFGLGLLSFAASFASLFFLSAFFFEKSSVEKFRREALRFSKDWRASAKFLGLLAGGLLFFALLFHSHSLEPKADGLYSGGSTWGDLALHLTLINNFLQNPALSLEYPVFSGLRLGYPFLTDFFTAALAFKSDVGTALIVFGASFSACLVALLYFFAKSFQGNERGARISVFLLLFAGGLSAHYLLAEGFAGAGFKDFQAFGSHLDFVASKHSHSFVAEKFNIQFTNFVTDFWLPQRNNLIAFCAALLAFSLLWKNRAEKKKEELLFAGLALGMAPLFSFHAFASALFAACISGLFFLDLSSLKGLVGDLKKASWFLAPAILMAIPQVLWSLPQASGASSALRFNIGWMSGGEGVFVFLLNNFGLFLPLAIIAFFKSGSDQKKFYSGFAALFLAANLFIFQPWDYDNAKFFFAWLVPTAALCGGFVGRVAGESKYRRLAAAVLVLLICLSGFFFVAREAGLSWKMYSSQDVEFSEWVKLNTPGDAVFLTSGEHNHPVPSLAGRSIVLGYSGWLWSHGINYSQREKDVAEMFAGGKNAVQLMGKYKVEYAVVGPSEKNRLNANQSFFEENFEKIYGKNGFEVFRAK